MPNADTKTMSTKTEDTTEADTVQEVTKKVDLVCYLKMQEGETRRQLADRLDDERDYFAKGTETFEDVTYFLKFGGEEIEIEEEEYDKLQGVDLGQARLSREVEQTTSEDYKHRPDKPFTSMVGGVIGDIYDGWGDEPEGWKINTFSHSLREEDGNGRVFTRTEFERMPMLKHKSEISPEDMYEDEDEEFLALKVSVRVRNVTPEMVDWFDENLTGELMKRLGRHEWVEKVRMYDCEQETKETGVCFNI